VELTADQAFLRCTVCGRRYPIDRGIAVMTVEAALPPEPA